MKKKKNRGGKNKEERKNDRMRRDGILSAHQAGMKVIMVPDLVQPTEEIRKLTYRVCDSLADVIGDGKSGFFPVPGGFQAR